MKYVARKKKNREKKFNSNMQGNLILVFFAVILLFVGLVGRLVQISKEDGERYEKKVLSQQTYMSNAIPFQRGSIVDRNNTVLAKSEKVYNLVLDSKVILEKAEYKEPTLKAVSSCFNISVEELNKVLKEKPESRYVVLLKTLFLEQVEPYKVIAKKDKNIQGVWFEEDYKRVYPLNSVACDVVGFTNSKGREGISGLELSYNSELNGSNGREYGYFDAERNLKRTVKPAVNGNTIVTTLDVNVQTIVEKHIKKFNEDVGSKNTAVVVMNPNNGEIYAMSSEKPYDLNNPWDLTPFYTKAEIKNMDEKEKIDALNGIWRNFCISDAYEPGSTFKPVTVSAALEEAIETPNSTFYCPGYQVIAGTRIKCNSRNHNTLTLEQTLMKSCNSAMMQMGSRIGKMQFSKYLKLFGFGSKTGIDLSGETTGALFVPEKMGPVDLAVSSFGQGISVNMLQIASAVSSTINGGHYYQPHAVKLIRNENKAIVKSMDPILVRDTVSPATSSFVKEALHKTVQDKMGTATAAQVPGYEIGGKTGTAQKLPRANKKYLVSFIGFTPIEEPKVVVYVVVDEPDVADQAHSTFASELCRDIMKEILPFLEIYSSEETIPNKAVTDKKKESDKKEKADKKEEEAKTNDKTNTENSEKIEESEDIFTDEIGVAISSDEDIERNIDSEIGILD